MPAAQKPSRKVATRSACCFLSGLVIGMSAVLAPMAIGGVRLPVPSSQAHDGGMAGPWQAPPPR